MNRIVHFGMELKTVALEGIGPDSGIAMVGGAFGRRRETQLLELGSYATHRVVVTHPHLLYRIEAGKDLVLTLQMEFCPPPLPSPVRHRAAVMLGDLLVTEAEPHDGNVEIVDLLGVVRILPVGSQTRASRDDDSLVGRKGFDGVLGLANLSQYSVAAHLRGDEVCVLPTEIDYGNGVVFHISEIGMIRAGCVMSLAA